MKVIKTEEVKMIKVVSFKICPFVQRVTALLEAKSIPYEIEYISLSDKPEWFLDLSPNGQVPLLILESGQALFESDAIVEYLEEAYPPLESKVSLEQKAKNRAWSYLATKNYLVQCSTMRSSDTETLEQKKAKLSKAFATIEMELTDKPYFNGENLSMVDIAWLPLLHRASIIEEHTCYDLLEGSPKTKQWQQWLLNLEITSRSVADDFEQVFTQFYLSEQTYLGKLAAEACTNRDNNCCGDSACCGV